MYTVYICICIFTHAKKQSKRQIYIYIYKNIHIYLQIQIHIYIQIRFIYIYTNLHIYTSIEIYIYIYTGRCTTYMKRYTQSPHHHHVVTYKCPNTWSSKNYTSNLIIGFKFLWSKPEALNSTRDTCCTFFARPWLIYGPISHHSRHQNSPWDEKSVFTVKVESWRSCFTLHMSHEYRYEYLSKQK